MLYMNVEAGSRPARVTMETLPDRTIVRLADNVATFQTEGEDVPQTMCRYDEVVFDLPEDRTGETVATIEANFSDWWAYGQADAESSAVTLEDRITALEEMYMLGMEG